MKENQRVSLTKRLLKEGLLRLMAHKPLEKISVSELCAEAGINRATFYRHYELPRDVLNDIEHELIGGLGFENWKITGIQDIALYAETTLQHLYNHAPILRILLRNRSDEEFTRIINEMCDRIFSLRTSLQIVKDLDADSIRLISAYSVGGVYFLLRQWLLEGIDKTPGEISQLILQMLHFGTEIK